MGDDTHIYEHHTFAVLARNEDGAPVLVQHTFIVAGVLTYEQRRYDGREWHREVYIVREACLRKSRHTCTSEHPLCVPRIEHAV